MIKLFENGIYLKNGSDIIDKARSEGFDQEAARQGTIAYRILREHNAAETMEKLRIRFDKLTSHDITFVGIIQTARASGLTEFPIPYVLTNCHNSLCAVGGTINEDDHRFGLSCAKRYGGIYVPPHQAVIHQYAREMLAECGKMILGSDSHTRYGALGTMAIGEGGPELVKQLLKRTYDIDMPGVIAVYLKGEPGPGIGPQDVALAIIGAVFKNGYVKNKVMEFVGPGVSKLSADFRIGIDVMTTETTCLSSIWQTDERIEEFYEIHGRKEAYKELRPAETAYYDGCIEVDLSEIRPMIAMPFHPSNTYTIDELNENLTDILKDVEEKARVSFDGQVEYSLMDKVVDGRLLVEQGIIAGCAGGGFENICAAADILNGKSIGSDEFTLSVYPASMPIYMELIKNGCAAKLMETGAVLKTAFCGPCFGAGDTPANQAFSIRHSTRNFPNREGSKLQNGQIASVALMDARSIAATAANKGFLTPADKALEKAELNSYRYFFDANIYKNRIFDAWNNKELKDPTEEIRLGPNIKDWPEMIALPENILLRVVSEIHDPVTTTDELIPSGETSSFRSNPLGLAEFALSRKDPAYVGRAKEIKRLEEARIQKQELSKVGVSGGPDDGTSDAVKDSEAPADGKTILKVLELIKEKYPEVSLENTGFGSTIFAVKPGDGSAREQAASCQRVLGGLANIANEYATKRYRSNLINWGMLPFITGEDHNSLPFKKLDYIFVPGIRRAVEEKSSEIKGFVIRTEDTEKSEEISLKLGDLTDDERQIILDGCLINYYRGR